MPFQLLAILDYIIADRVSDATFSFFTLKAKPHTCKTCKSPLSSLAGIPFDPFAGMRVSLKHEKNISILVLMYPIHTLLLVLQV
jgi:hypothetical protein